MYRLCMDKTRKIRPQYVRKLDLKDRKDVGKMHSEKTKEKISLLFHRGGNLFNHHLMTGDAEMPVSLMIFFKLRLHLKKADVISLLAPLTKAYELRLKQ